MSMKACSAAALLALALFAAPAALAGAPQPAKPVAPSLYTGRWYEIARTPNHMQGDCQAATSDFSGWSGGAFSLTQTCRQGAPNGPAQVTKVSGSILPASSNAKMRLAMMGGLLSQEYWIVDHADDNAWAIMATPGGHFVWLLSRQPVVSPAVRAGLVARVQALGFDVSHLTYEQQPPR
jgi:apolipoprotein D and lipocalin family protein